MVTGGIGGALLVGAVSVSVGGWAWTVESLQERITPADESLGQRFQRSSTGRWWHCRGVPRPVLTTLEAEWSLQYSWTGGYGRGDVFLDLRSDGTARLSLHEHGMPPRVQASTIPSDTVQRLATVIDSTGFLCLTPLKREDHQIIDLGRYAVRIETLDYLKEVFAGQCHYVADLAAFRSVRDAIYDLESMFGERFSWGPFGTTTLPRPCDGQTS